MGGLREYTEDFFTELFSYTRRERRGIVLFSAVVLAVLSYVFIFSERALDGERLRGIDAALDSLYARGAVPAGHNIKNPPLFVFDPNTITVEELVHLGFSPKQAAAIDNYRRAGAVFRKPEDFRRSFVVSDGMYLRLEPFIEIKQAAAPVPERRPKPAAAPVELNRADSAALVGVRGIGEVLSARIISYRERLGGFVEAGQLKEVWGIDDTNFGLISEQIFVDSAEIQKIDINFAPANVLVQHPYITRSMAARIEAGRKIKGGWRNLKELTDNDILLPDEAGRIAAYVVFGQ